MVLFSIFFLLIKALEAAAFSSRLPHDKMTSEEVNLFPDIVSEDITLTNSKQIERYKTFLLIRNKTKNSLIVNSFYFLAMLLIQISPSPNYLSGSGSELLIRIYCKYMYIRIQF